MPDYGSYPDGAPAQSTDRVLARRTGTPNSDVTLTIAEIISGVFTTLSTVSPAALTDLVTIVRSGVAENVTLADALDQLANKTTVTSLALTDKVASVVSGAVKIITLQNLLNAAASLSTATPAALTDAVMMIRSGVAELLSAGDILDGANLKSTVTPAQTSDKFVIIRSGVMKLVSESDVAALITGSTMAFPEAAGIINGSFRFAQRNTTQVLTNSMVFGSLDRWCFAMSGTAAGNATQQTSPPAGVTGVGHRLRLQRTAASTSTGTLYGAYIFESIDAIALQGQQITISWDAAGGANFSPTSGNYSVKVFYGTGTDQGAASYFAGTWTGQAQVTGSPFTKSLTPGANAARHSITITVPTTATELALEISFTPTGTAGSDDSLYLGRVKYEFGATATTPVLPPIARELQDCQRFYEKSFPLTTVVPSTGTTAAHMLPGPVGIGNGNYAGSVYYKVRKRATGTVSTWSCTSNTASTLSNGGGTDLASGSGTPAGAHQDGFYVQNSAGSSVAPTLNSVLFHWACDAELV